MYKKKIQVIICSVCGGPGGNSVSCNYCKEKSKDKSIKPTHTLCNDCFMRGCPTVYQEKGIIIPKLFNTPSVNFCVPVSSRAPRDFWFDVGEW